MKFFNDISGKAALYAIPLFLTPFVDKLGTLLLNGTWPTPQAVVGCTLLGVCAASIGLRAFFDGSYERRKSGSDSDDLPVTPPAVETKQIPVTPVQPTKPTP